MKADMYKLATIMARQSLNQKALAAKSGLHPTVVSRVCCGRSSLAITLARVALALGVDVTEIVAEEDSHGQE